MNQKIAKVSSDLTTKSNEEEMPANIGQNGLENQLDCMVREFIKERLGTIMKKERDSFFEHEHLELKNHKNGHCMRQLDTK